MSIDTVDEVIAESRAHQQLSLIRVLMRLFVGNVIQRLQRAWV